MRVLDALRLLRSGLDPDDDSDTDTDPELDPDADEDTSASGCADCAPGTCPYDPSNFENA